MRYFFSCILLILGFFCELNAQVTITGKLVAKNNESIIGATVVLQNTRLGAVSDINGRFSIQAPSQSTYTLQVSYVGYETQLVNLNNSKGENTLQVSIRLKESQLELNELKIIGRKKTTELKESPQSINSIDVKAVAERSVNTLQLLNSSSGVRVQQRGGLGSDFNVSINGISGKQVKLFVDGVPLDNVGFFTDFYSLPISQIDRLDIYKGVVPISLGADALGGAINLVSKNAKTNLLEVNQEFASFQTQRTSFFSKFYLPKTPFSVGVNAYYNQSANTYKSRGEVRNPDFTTDTSTFKRFHDGFTSRMVQIELAVYDRTWADLLSASFKWTSVDKELQQNPYFLRAYEVFAHAKFQEEAQKMDLRYEKKNLVNGRLNIQNYSLYTKIQALLLDTGRSDYNWRGEAYQRPSSGAEISGTPHTLHLNTLNFLNKSYASFKLNKNFSLEANAVLSNVQQQGEDTSAAKRNNKPIEDVYKTPQYVRKLVAGFGINSNFWQNRIRNELGVKYYEIGFRIVEAPGILIGETTTTNSKASHRGAFNAFRIDLVKDVVAIKTSFEHAARLPDQYEVIGDRVFILPNPKLKPEISNNLNAGFQLSSLSKLGAIRFDVNYFYRHAKNNIFLVVSTISQYQNVATVKTQGLEGEVSYLPLPFVKISANATYQDIRNYSDTTALNPTVNKRYYKARLPNRPIFYSNTEVNLFYPELFQKNDKVQLYWWANFTGKFYRSFAIDGDPALKESIPEQFVQNLGIAYSWQSNRYSLSAELHNLQNAQAFDYFAIQKPGRSFHIKASINLNSTQKNTSKNAE